MTLHIRAADLSVELERVFIRSGWSASLASSRSIPLVPREMHASVYHPVIDHFLDQPDVSLLVAHGSTGVRFGFIAYSPEKYQARLGQRLVSLYGHVYYLYVAASFRKRKFGLRLLEAAGLDRTRPFGYACQTRSSWLLRFAFPEAQYDPFKARYLTYRPSVSQRRDDEDTELREEDELHAPRERAL